MERSFQFDAMCARRKLFPVARSWMWPRTSCMLYVTSLVNMKSVPDTKQPFIILLESSLMVEKRWLAKVSFCTATDQKLCITSALSFRSGLPLRTWNNLQDTHISRRCGLKMIEMYPCYSFLILFIYIVLYLQYNFFPVSLQNDRDVQIPHYKMH